MAELLNELKNGRRAFTMIGEVKIGADTFGGAKQPTKPGSDWVSVDTAIPIEITEGVTLFPRIKDGFSSKNPKISRQAANFTDPRVELSYKDRLNEAFIEKISYNELYHAMVEKDETGKPIQKSFIHGIDFESYLKAHLKNGMNVRITGEVNYSYDKDRQKVYRNYKLKAVRLNEGYKKNGEDIPPAPASATINQTLLLEAGALNSRWEKELESTGKTAVNVHVADYVSSVWVDNSWVKLGKTAAFPQQVFLTADPTDEKSLSRSKVLANRLFNVPKRKIRELNAIVQINEGSETTSANIEIDKDLQELIDLGYMSEEDVVKQVTVRGNRVSELLFVKPQVRLTDEGSTVIDMNDDKYALDVLLFPQIEAQKEVASKKSEAPALEADPLTEMSDETFDSLFAEML